MRHEGLRAGAALNPNPQWPEGYLTVRREAGTKGKSLPSCVKWVLKFLARHPGRRWQELRRDDLEAFLADTGGLPYVANWQVQQARDALELFFEQFLGVRLDPRHDLSVAASSATRTSAPPRRHAPKPQPERHEGAEEK